MLGDGVYICRKCGFKNTDESLVESCSELSVPEIEYKVGDIVRLGNRGYKWYGVILRGPFVRRHGNKYVTRRHLVWYDVFSVWSTKSGSTQLPRIERRTPASFRHYE